MARVSLHISRDIGILGYSVYLVQEGAGVGAITFAKQRDEASQPLPTLVIHDKTELQQFMDELWRVGIRPSEGEGSAGSLAATQAHLKDMQGLVEKLLPSAIRKA